MSRPSGSVSWSAVGSAVESRIQALLDGAEDADEKLGEFLSAASVEDWLVAARHTESSVRRVAIVAAHERREAAVFLQFETLATDKSSGVRSALAELFHAASDVAFPETAVHAMLADRDEHVRAKTCAAARDVRYRPRLLELLSDGDWTVREAAANVLGGHRSAEVARCLLDRLASEEDVDVQRALVLALEPQFGPEGDRESPTGSVPPIGKLREIQTKLNGLTGAPAPRVRLWLAGLLAKTPDPERLREFGPELGAAAHAGDLPRAYHVDRATTLLMEHLHDRGSRSAILVGESGVGKTAVVHELVHRLQDNEAWHVVRVSPSDLLSGTRFLGEWETKVTRLIEAAQRPKRVLLYIPNVDQLTMAGAHSSSSRSIADMLAPHIESGALAILGETTPESLTAGFARHPSLLRLFKLVEVHAASSAQTRELLDLVCAEADADPSEETLDRLMDLVDLYQPSTAQPGRAIALLRETLGRVGSEFEAADILESLQNATGMPLTILDDTAPLDLDETRRFFEDRVMGQDAGVMAVVDLVTLIKAGLNDPSKPYGVFLFVGPTGVGKTEMSRALAEYLFGDASRLLRFDMSEYATYGAFERLIGSQQSTGLLTEAVRAQPFSVILLDEIEKGHVNVFDLCLQMFDAGRLTDGMGRTADMRNTIIILTSNVGSQLKTDAQLGFGDHEPPPPDQETIQRELRRSFRPEFLNRLDRIVYFEPLAERTAEKIARRELSRVIERSGIARRRLIVDVGDDVVPMLLKRGYSLAFGARPLKRTVERLVLLPLARAIADGAIQPDSTLRLTVKGDHIVPVVVALPDQENRDSLPVAAARSLAEVEEELRTLRERLGAMDERKDELFARTHRSDFWENRPRALRTMDEIHRLAHVLDGVGRLERELARTGQSRQPERAQAFLEKHAREAAWFRFLLDRDDWRDAFVTLTRVKTQGAALDGLERLARMYHQLAGARALECDVLDDRRASDGSEDTITLAVGGAVAHALFCTEAGLHQFTRGPSGRRDDRELVRVEVWPAHSIDADKNGPTIDGVEFDVKRTAKSKGRFGQPLGLDVHLFHRTTMVSVRAHAVDQKDVVIPRLQALLQARIDAVDTPTPARDVIRRYQLGPSPLVRDRRTGQQSGRLRELLKGDWQEWFALARGPD